MLGWLSTHHFWSTAFHPTYVCRGEISKKLYDGIGAESGGSGNPVSLHGAKYEGEREGHFAPNSPAYSAGQRAAAVRL